MKLEDMIASVGASVQAAQAALDRTATEQYLSYFHPSDNDLLGGALTPHTLSLSLPGQDKERVVELPLVALCSHSTMSFDQVTVRLQVALDAPQDGQDLDAVPVAAGQGGHQIELTFRRQEPAEAVSRFNEAAGQIL